MPTLRRLPQLPTQLGLFVIGLLLPNASNVSPAAEEVLLQAMRSGLAATDADAQPAE